ncbi:MAG TPA: polysaccharide deacetylase family protein [Chitinophagaceae bacterium]|nr:polysaccharide deacetylase family protein [Chitinophagaceae bacterium]
MFYTIRTPWILKQLYRHCLWEMPAEDNKVYLSFDDGPHPIATPFVLDQLKEYGAKGSFFCIGQNVKMYPDLYQRIIQEGHSTGNHTYRHPNGWQTTTEAYIADAREAQPYIQSKLFRPPYGRISFSQLRKIRNELGLKPVMWSLVSGDFDTAINGEQCAENVLKNFKPGDIIVFHDSEKAFERLRYALPLVLEAIRARGWVTEKLH